MLHLVPKTNGEQHQELYIICFESMHSIAFISPLLNCAFMKAATTCFLSVPLMVRIFKLSGYSHSSNPWGSLPERRTHVDWIKRKKSDCELVLNKQIRKAFTCSLSLSISRSPEPSALKGLMCPSAQKQVNDKGKTVEKVLVVYKWDPLQCLHVYQIIKDLIMGNLLEGYMW